MKKFFFCARNLKDYISPILKGKEKDLSKIPNQALLVTDEVQKILKSILTKYLAGVEYFDTPVSDAIETGLQGVKLDFNFGLRLEVPDGIWRVKISDVDSGEIFFDNFLSNLRLLSLETYYINWKVEIFHDDEKVFDYALDLKNKNVLMFIPKIGMGDVISMLPYVEEFRRRHGCKISVILPEYLREFAEHLYPKFTYEKKISYRQCATYPLVMPADILPVWLCDMRNYPIYRIAGAVLGLNNIATYPDFKPTRKPLVNDPYVCIAVQASHPKKTWLYPKGWDIVVDYLKSLGYRVFCIDRHLEVSDGDFKVCKPSGAEDVTGAFSIMERANMLYYAEFFIGLGSGLSWLANAVKCPVVMICGFSQDWCEFYTPYRVANRLVCNGCLNDIRVNYFKKTCPYHEGTPRELECQKKISPQQVMNAIERLIIDENLTPPVLQPKS